MSNEFLSPWRFDGHGINNAKGERIAKVSFTRYGDGNTINPLFDKYSILLKEAPTMLETLERILPALETAAHLMRLNGNEEEYQLFKKDAQLVRETILGTKEEK